MKKALSLLLAALLLAGCAAQPAPESAASPPPDSVAVESPSRPLATPSGEGAAQASQVVETTLSSGVVVQAEVSYPPVDFSSLASYQASLHRFDPQQARQLLLGDAPLAQEEQQAVKGSAFQDAMWHMYVTEDGQNLVVIEENLYYFNDGWNQDTTQYFYPGPESLDYNGDAFQTGKELAFATAEECFAQAKETLSQLGIAVADSYDCFTLDSETLQAGAEKVRERLVQNGVGLWTDEAGEPLSREESLAQYPLPQYLASQDCYYFQLYARAGACPVTRQSTGVAASGGYTMGAVIDCAYSAKGLVMLSISPTYDVGESQGEAPCLDLEGALEALDSKYNSLLLESPCQVEQIAFEYVPLGTGDGIHVTLIPAWRFLVKQELTFPGKEDASETVTMEQASYVFFNAATGQEIVTDLGGI